MLNIRGYTLLEVSLFLAISGALTLIALVSLGPRLRNVRFSTTMRDLHSNVIKQLSTSERGNSGSTGGRSCSVDASGLSISNDNDRSSGTPCVYVGRVALFGEGVSNERHIEYHSIVAALNPIGGPGCGDDGDSSSLEYTFNCSQARLLGGFEQAQTFDYTNQLTQAGSTKYGYGFVKTVDTNTTHHFLFTYSGDISDTMLNNSDLSYISGTAQICYAMSGRRAALELSPEYSEPKLLFNQGGC